MNLIKIGKRINQALIKRFSEQGHHLTGGWENYLQLKQSGNVLTCTGAPYTKYLDRGVTADRIPFNPGSGAKASKYISALAQYAKIRNIADNDKEAISIAFAIARKHKQEGMPTRASRRFSSTGKRTEFLTDVLKEIAPEIRQTIAREYGSELQTIINNQIRNLQL